MCLVEGPQRSDASEAPARDRSVSSQTLYYWATALPRNDLDTKWLVFVFESSWMSREKGDKMSLLSKKL